MKRAIALSTGILLLFALGSVARAHAEIASCTPPINGSVDKAPDKLVCKASESLDPKGSSLSVWSASGVQVDKGDSAVDLTDPDRVTIAVSFDAAMMSGGVYTVKWKTLSSVDGDEANGEFKVTVGLAVDTETPASATSTPLATTAATLSPTLVPTSVPTVAPTSLPTLAPTIVPTLLATSVPTLVPTLVPTIVPTQEAATPTPMPVTQIPTSGTTTDAALYVLVALLGVGLLGAGTLAVAHSRDRR